MITAGEEMLSEEKNKSIPEEVRIRIRDPLNFSSLKSYSSVFLKTVLAIIQYEALLICNRVAGYNRNTEKYSSVPITCSQMK